MSASPSDSEDPTDRYHDVFHDAEDTQEEDEDYAFQEESDDDDVDFNDLFGVTDHFHGTWPPCLIYPRDSARSLTTMGRCGIGRR